MPNSLDGAESEVQSEVIVGVYLHQVCRALAKKWRTEKNGRCATKKVGIYPRVSSKHIGTNSKESSRLVFCHVRLLVGVASELKNNSRSWQERDPPKRKGPINFLKEDLLSLDLSVTRILIRTGDSICRT